MELFIDTANIEEIRKANDMGVISGVTTNPSLIAKEGRDFKQVHEYLETLYDGVSDVLDEAAELLKMQGAQPLASLKDYLAAASLQELPSAELHSGEVLSIVHGDLAALRDQAQQIRTVAAAEDNYAVVSMMESHLAQYNKTLWFVEAMQK